MVLIICRMYVEYRVRNAWDAKSIQELSIM